MRARYSAEVKAARGDSAASGFNMNRVARALREHDVEVPRDIAVLGTDDLAYCELCSPSLSTIRFDSSALGERAVALINSLITGEPPEDRFLQAPIPYVIQREST